MRRAGRLLLLVLTLLSAVLCVATSVFWIRSHSSYDQVGRRTTTLLPAELTHRTRELTSVEGRIVVRLETARLTSDNLKSVTPEGRKAASAPSETYWRRGDGSAPFWSHDRGSILNRLGFGSVRTQTSGPFYEGRHVLTSFQLPMFVATQSRDTRLFMFPHWFPALACAIAPTLAARKVLIRRRTASRLARGHCPACAYDLRSSPDRCPECGGATVKTG